MTQAVEKFQTHKFILSLSVFVMVLFTGASDAASFNCAKAKTDVEKLICSNKPLSILDDTLNNVYTLYQSATLWTDSVKKEQAEWCKKERDTCKSVATLEQSMQKRIAFFRSRLSDFEKTHGKVSDVVLWRWKKNDDGSMMPWLIDTSEYAKMINQQISEKCRNEESDPKCKPTQVNPTVTCSSHEIFSFELAFSPDDNCEEFAHPIEAWTDYYSYDMKTGSTLSFQQLFKNWNANKETVLARFVGDDKGGYDDDTTCNILETISNGDYLYDTPLFTNSGITIQTQFPYVIRACSNTYTVPYNDLMPYVDSDSPIIRWKTGKK